MLQRLVETWSCEPPPIDVFLIEDSLATAVDGVPVRAAGA